MNVGGRSCSGDDGGQRRRLCGFPGHGAGGCLPGGRRLNAIASHIAARVVHNALGAGGSALLERVPLVAGVIPVEVAEPTQRTTDPSLRSFTLAAGSAGWHHTAGHALQQLHRRTDLGQITDVVVTVLGRL